ncbi:MULTISPECIES: PhzF family phenazine biosynthesis protein [Rhodomicrobium]|uniref:PhzF family phenazine biosynthesis protein n=1 Tax=Rhodomicrobium TaxID=1068 RepID=UPI000B4ACAE4|nr:MULTISPECIES: PhzF family phenazine biosynthesis protein [Rhodomicrobium]
MERRYTLLHVFTKQPDGGNPLAVMSEVDGLDDAAMQAIAHRIGLSETVFVFPPKNPAHLASIRIFTPASELPFAGHPTVGTAICLTQERIWRDKGTEFDALAVLECKGGILRVAVRPGSGTAFAEFDAPTLPYESGEAAPSDRLAAALGLAPSEIGFENFRPRRFTAGNAFTFVPVAGLTAMGRAHVVPAFWDQAFGGDSHPAAYLYCRETLQHKAGFHARAFVPGMGVPEDPATGSAAAAFAGIINLFDGPPEGVYRTVIEQGIEMGRPSEIFLEFEVKGRAIRGVRIGGYAMIVGQETVAV